MYFGSLYFGPTENKDYFGALFFGPPGMMAVPAPMPTGGGMGWVADIGPETHPWAKRKRNSEDIVTILSAIMRAIDN